jgi:dCMP deaminase
MRPSIHETFMGMVEVMAEQSTCARIRTASLIVRDKRIISTGYNGVCAGEEHCVDHWGAYWDVEMIPVSFGEWTRTDEFKQLHRAYSANELHAERNAILFAAKEGISTNGSTIYTLYSPCMDCATSIYSAGIKRLYYKHKYDRDGDVGLSFLSARGVEVHILV